jgi:polyferredoxin
MAASLFYFGFWREGCVCPIGAIQNVTLALFDSSYAMPLGVLAFFLLPLVFALFFGRAFCAAVCPLGAVQDVVLARPLRVPPWLEHGLRLLAYVYLGLAVLFAATGSAFVICQYDPFVGFFRVSGSTSMLILGGCMLLVGIFVGRPYCRFLCPYGVLLGLLSRASSRRVTITPDECVHCRLCEDACPFGAIQRPTEELKPQERAEGKRRLALLLGVLPVLIVLGALLGGSLRTPLSKMHATVRLAERVALEEAGEAEGLTDASEAFRDTGRPFEELYAEARALRSDSVTGGRLLGAFVGLVVGIKLMHLSIRRQRLDYEADRAACLACGRCYDYCPVELDRRKKARETAK